ncbi:hypothetical protein QYE76_004967 [Lolium multiflorum]|uniref:Uncharacterized protein n=1 Tax=Lolium multiflorum TaxID=4521 RepID=A0AAD8RTH7_LOLMU|nr:hypothetical protein QYE76_004967 [Lolium multiflorum]
MSTSNTVVLSEENRAVADSSPPPQQIVDTSTPPPSPRAPSPKRLKTGAGDEQTLILGSSSTPMMNDSLCSEPKNARKLSKLKLREEPRKKADAASVEDLRQRLSKAETVLSDKIVEQIAREQGMINRLEAQRRNDESFKLLAPKDDRLLDFLSILELQGDLACTKLSNLRIAFTRMFSHFFRKQTEPEIVTDLVKHFLPSEDLALAYRRENLKISVEGTIALVANSGQQVDWAKAGDVGKINDTSQTYL